MQAKYFGVQQQFNVQQAEKQKSREAGQKKIINNNQIS